MVLKGTVDLEREDGEECEENMEVFDDSSSSPSGTLRNYPLTCKVLYSYKVRDKQIRTHPCMHRAASVSGLLVEIPALAGLWCVEQMQIK